MSVGRGELCVWCVHVLVRGRERGLCGVPVKAGFDHQIYGVAVFYVVLLEELCVCESLSLEQQALCVCRRCAWLGCEMRFDVGDGVGGLYGEGETARRLQGFERNLDGGHCRNIRRLKRANVHRGRGVPASVDDSALRSGTGGTGIYTTWYTTCSMMLVRTDRIGTRLRAR